jgi:hypothetical protein
MKKFLPAALAVAAVAALSGGSVAVAGDLIGSRDIADNTVKSKDVRDGTIKVKDLHKVAARKLLADTAGEGVPGPQGEPGVQGPAGLDGARGPQGVAGVAGSDGEDGVSGYEVRSWDYALVSGGGWADMGCTKDSGRVPLGGGYHWKDETVAMERGLSVVTSMPGRMDWSTNTPDATKPGWIIRPNKPANVNPGALTVYVICAQIGD